MSSSAAAMNSLSRSAAPNKKAKAAPSSWLLELLHGKERSDFAAHCLDEISAYLEWAGALYSCHRDLAFSDSRHLRYVPDFKAGIPNRTWHEALKRGYWDKDWDTETLTITSRIHEWTCDSFPYTARIAPKPWGHNLTAVSLRNCSRFGCKTIGMGYQEEPGCHTAQLMRFCPALKSLDLSGTSISVDDIKHIGKSKTLTHLDVSNNLCFQNYNLSGSQTKPLGFGNVRHTLKSLKARNNCLRTSDILNLCGWDSWDTEPIPKFGCRKLTALDVSGNELANGAVICIWRTLAGLRSLNLSHNPNILFHGVQSIFGGCRDLTELNLEGTDIDPADCCMLAVSTPKCRIEFDLQSVW